MSRPHQTYVTSRPATHVQWVEHTVEPQTPRKSRRSRPASSQTPSRRGGRPYARYAPQRRADRRAWNHIMVTAVLAIIIGIAVLAGVN